MTELTIKLKDDSKLSLLLALLRRWTTSEGVELAVEQNGQGVALDHTTDDDARFDAMVDQIIADAMAGRLEALTPEEIAASEQSRVENGAKRAVEFGITSDEDVVRIVNEYRREQREKAAA